MADAGAIPAAARRRHRRAEPPPTVQAAPVPRVLLDASEAAAACGVSRAFFLSLVDAGRAPRGCRLGRRRLWPVDALEAWAASGCGPR